MRMRDIGPGHQEVGHHQEAEVRWLAIPQDTVVREPREGNDTQSFAFQAAPKICKRGRLCKRLTTGECDTVNIIKGEDLLCKLIDSN